MNHRNRGNLPNYPNFKPSPSHSRPDGTKALNEERDVFTAATTPRSVTPLYTPTTPAYKPPKALRQGGNFNGPTAAPFAHTTPVSSLPERGPSAFIGPYAPKPQRKREIDPSDFPGPYAPVASPSAISEVRVKFVEATTYRPARSNAIQAALKKLKELEESALDEIEEEVAEVKEVVKDEEGETTEGNEEETTTAKLIEDDVVNEEVEQESKVEESREEKEEENVEEEFGSK